MFANLILVWLLAKLLHYRRSNWAFSCGWTNWRAKHQQSTSIRQVKQSYNFLVKMRFDLSPVSFQEKTEPPGQFRLKAFVTGNNWAPGKCSVRSVIEIIPYLENVIPKAVEWIRVSNNLSKAGKIPFWYTAYFTN